MREERGIAPHFPRMTRPPRRLDSRAPVTRDELSMRGRDLSHVIG
jgi:hypothetical protein